MPWIILSVLLFTWGLPAVKSFMNQFALIRIPVPYLDQAVMRMPPVVAEPHAEAAVFAFNWLSATGTGLLVTAILSGLYLGIGFGGLVRIFGKTLHRVRFSLLTMRMWCTRSSSALSASSFTSMAVLSMPPENMTSVVMASFYATQNQGACTTISLMSVRKLLDLSGKTALVTGGSRGLGLQIAEALGEMGARLAITARKKDEVDEAAKKLGALGVVSDIGNARPLRRWRRRC